MALGGNKQGPAGRKAGDTIRRLEGLRKDATRPVTVRLDPRLVDRLEAIAERKGLKLGQLLRSWIVERLDSELR